ncbi:MmcQ/YjbR family DNA-binding protein [Demequina muriae]|uniref:MmcQ/YjbR family DNA-binding protein n=1 Tax=Demequina muriae TaxID=3051664 RepID=A0ABT8GII4_9MICO|nr:MmcQ/YjbR family DNA-binding protein [Demequina sp. EGI L300058]MDN4481086.1 MmcQ/YjbR family DNA-binding protein [Demequina sp. EGI L300058]
MSEPAEVPDVDPWMMDVLSRLPGAQVVPYPAWGSQTFQVGGKHFGRLGLHPSGARIITVKGDPDVNAALVAQFEAVTPGYYADKRRWISIEVDDPAMPRDVAIEALETAYALVRQGLPKRVQASLG